MKFPFNTYTGLLGTVVLFLFFLASCTLPEKSGDTEQAEPEIYPPYYDLTIPPNIAPLNFIIREEGSRFLVEISGKESAPIVIRSRSPRIKIPRREWAGILAENTGGTLTVQVRVKRQGQWTEYSPVHHYVAKESIDPYLVYRLVYAVYLKWYDMGIYQRNLTGFEERPVIENESFDHGCVNCHSFSNNDPSKMMMHFRIRHAGTVILNGDSLVKIDTKTQKTISAGIYPSWHPSGKYIAFSTGRISPHPTSRFNKVVDVADRESDLMVYDVEKQEVRTDPAISGTDRENLPVWSPDGRRLYFISAPAATERNDESLLHERYSLKSIPYSPGLDKWGTVETILDADSVGKSISMPAISPDGRYMLCSMSDYGYFTIFHEQSDLYCINLATKEYHKMELNSDDAESWSAWSSNGRWIIFSSKRLDGVLSRPHIAYFDENGVSHKPFVLPQKDPRMYDRLLANYNLPKPVTGEVPVGPDRLHEILMKPARSVK
jgi:hypothetical protein